MKQNITSAPAPASPRAWKIILAAAVILVAGMLVFAVRSVFNVLRAPPLPPAAVETSAPNEPVPPIFSVETALPAAVPENSGAAAPQFETVRQREQARADTVAALQQRARERAGTNALSGEELEKIARSDPYIQ